MTTATDPKNHERITFDKVYQPGTGEIVDTTGFFHCGELHEQIGILLSMLGGKLQVALADCSRCGRMIVSQTQDYPSRRMQVQNSARDICQVCTEELHETRRNDELVTKLEELSAMALTFCQTAFKNGDVLMAQAWQHFSDMAAKTGKEPR